MSEEKYGSLHLQLELLETNRKLRKQIALLERKLDLVVKQRDKALYYVDHDNIALDFEAQFKKELEELK